MHLARFFMKSGGVFAKNQLVKVFLLKIGKRLIDLTLPKIVMYYSSWMTLAKAFALVEQCDRVLCQHDVTDLMSLLVDVTELKSLII
jgi:hypothetical protein